MIFISVGMFESEVSKQRNDVNNYFTCSDLSRHWEVFSQNLSQELVPIRAATTFIKSEQSLLERWRKIISNNYKQLKLDKFGFRPVSVQSEAQFHLLAVSLYVKQKGCEKIKGMASIQSKKCGMLWGPIVGVFVNMSVYFNKWANKLETPRYIFLKNSPDWKLNAHISTEISGLKGRV